MDKYKVTTAELFKIKMQLRAQINHLRKTYDEIVVQKHTPEKKHFPSRFQISSITQPQPQKSIKKQTIQRKHYSPNILNKSQTSLSLGKKQFIYKNQHQDVRRFNASKRKSSAYLLNIGRSSSVISIKNQSTGYNIGSGDKQRNKIQKPSKKIFFQKHQFNTKLI